MRLGENQTDNLLDAFLIAARPARIIQRELAAVAIDHIALVADRTGWVVSAVAPAKRSRND